MEIATVKVSIAGDSGNTVEKYDVTPAEVAVLRYIHGEDAVKDIEPTGVIDRGNRAERERLALIYTKKENNQTPVDALYPGVAARVFDTFDELELPEEFYKAIERVKPAAVKKVAKKGKAEEAAEGTESDMFD